MKNNARELVSAAEALLRPPAGTAGALSPGVRARAAAVLLRLALDQRLDDFWHGIAPGMTRVAKHRMLCLEAYTDRRTARRWRLTWSALSGVCHHRVPELPPMPAEIQARLLEVNALLDALDAAPPAVTAVTRVPVQGLLADPTTAPAAAPATTPAREPRAGHPVPKPGPPPGRGVVPRVVGTL
ncbi:hypothetical protein ACIQNU_15480 [Streptomyces sp. NPDC091292]|uniref:hypothetical protein n=1 Tax=Streptomyces sp. NPDC091292 TaxID=3365991 RepID=UPI0037F5D25E